jgi:hypothetical protein
MVAPSCPLLDAADHSKQGSLQQELSALGCSPVAQRPVNVLCRTRLDPGCRPRWPDPCLAVHHWASGAPGGGCGGRCALSRRTHPDRSRRARPAAEYGETALRHPADLRLARCRACRSYGRPFYSRDDLQYLEHGTGPLAAELARLWRAKGTINGGTTREEHGGNGDGWRAVPRGAAPLVPRRPHPRPVTELYYPGLQDPPPSHGARNAGSGQ